MSYIEQQIIKGIGFDPENEWECLEVIKNNEYIIEHIPNASEKVQLEFIKLYPNNLRYIRKPTEKVQLEVVKKCGVNIEDIQYPSIEVQKAAIMQSNFSMSVISLCPDWKELNDWIMDNLMIKDIIE
jgi:hypothetical protein